MSSPAVSSAEASSPTKPPSTRDVLLDSAFVVAFITGISFAVGYLVQVRDSQLLGVPPHLFPDLSAQTVAVIGALFVIPFIGFLLLVSLLGLLLVRLLPEARRQAITAGCQAALARHPRFYPVIGAFVVAAMGIVYVWYYPPGANWKYDDTRLAKVKSIQVKGNTFTLPKDQELFFVGFKDRLLVFKFGKINEYLIISADELLHLELIGHKQSMTARPPATRSE